MVDLCVVPLGAMIRRGGLCYKVHSTFSLVLGDNLTTGAKGVKTRWHRSQKAAAKGGEST